MQFDAVSNVEALVFEARLHLTIEDLDSVLGYLCNVVDVWVIFFGGCAEGVLNLASLVTLVNINAF